MKKKLTDLIIVGQIAGAHGVRGDVRVRSYTAEPGALFDYGPLLSTDGAILIEAVSVRAAKNSFVVTPRRPREKEVWDKMKGTPLCVLRSNLPPPAADEYYISDLVGLAVYSGGEQAVGHIKAVFNHGAGDVLEVSHSDYAKPVLIPFTEADVPHVDIARGRVVLGDMDLWLADSADATALRQT